MPSTTQPSAESPDRAEKKPIAPAARGASPVQSIEMVIAWGATVLHVGDLAPPRSFDLGESREDDRPCDCFLPEQVLGARRAPLLVVDDAARGEHVDRRVRFVLLPGMKGGIALGDAVLTAEEARELHAARASAEIEGAVEIPLGPGARVEVELSGVSFRLGAAAAVSERVGRPKASRRSLALYGISALLHIGALGAFALGAVPPPASDEEPSADQVFRMQQYLASASEREMEELEAEQMAEGAADAKEAGTGTRATGEEGAMGNPNTKATGNRYGARGPADSPDPHVAEQAALRDAAEFGMIGLLNSGSGGDPNAPAAPWGRDDSLANEPQSARGNLWDAPIGRGSGAAGAAGLGITGAGEGGSGIGLGSIGTIGHGAGTGTGQAYGAGSGTSGGYGKGYGAGSGASGGYGNPAAVAHPSAPPEEPINPNGRFATTYRPGGGHLAAFESAVARGVVPVAEREVVSDVGARYTPSFPVAPDRSLGMRADLERAALPPSGGAFHMRLALRSGATEAAARPHLSVHLVLDTSGSMQGEAIERARQAAQTLVDRLAPTDDFSLTTFSDGAEVKVSDGLVGARREAIKEIIAGLREGGGTNISEGLRLGYLQAGLKTIPEDAVRVVLLLSDGQPTSGITDRGRLARLALDAFQDGIQTSSFGLGTSYDGELMSAVASDGAGGYYYLRDPEQIAPALGAELDRRLDPVATAVEVRVRLAPGVELLKAFGSRRLDEAEAARVRTQEIAADVQAEKKDRIAVNRVDDAEGGMRFFMPAFARDDSHALLFRLRAASGAGARGVATVELRYKDRIAKRNVTEEIPIRVDYADSDASSAATQDASVARTVQGFAAGEALSEAALRISRGDRAGAAALLEEREGILRQAAETLSEPLFLTDATRLARLRGHAGSGAGLGDPLVLAMLLETAARSHLR